ncbi:MAG: hypothetical protein GY866_23410 [Proteobacteria bacterium]|nr:hypothetical protein [Pseudomonadota bacterium]
MAEVSSVYNMKNIYKTGARKKSNKDKNGDIKHIVFKDGIPVMTEIIKVGRSSEEPSGKSSTSKPRRIRSAKSDTRPRRSSEDVLKEKKGKLSQKLKKAVLESQTLWSEKAGVWISYQGEQGFLVKQYTPTNHLMSKKIMTREEILDSPINGILDTKWQIL